MSGGVALVVMATGRYIEFVPPLVASAQQHLVGLSTVFVLGDHRPPAIPGIAVRWLPWGHLPWPYSTLSRYRALTAYAEELRRHDVIVHTDADMVFVGPVDLSSVTGVFAVQHPGFVGRPVGEMTFERRPESRAYVVPGEGTTYVAGGVQGGRTADYLAACSVMAGWIQDDLDRQIVALWHDESIWNRYCITYPPEVVLPMAYCTPQSRVDDSTRIVALTKDHDRYRGVALSRRLARQARRRLARTRRRVSRLPGRLLGRG